MQQNKMAKHDEFDVNKRTNLHNYAVFVSLFVCFLKGGSRDTGGYTEGRK